MTAQHQHSDKKIVFFDGVCNLCNGAVDILIRNNPSKNLYFSSLQSDFAKGFLASYGFSSTSISTVYYYEDGQIYERSEAALRMYRHTSQPLKLLSYFLFVPSTIRDAIYNLIAKNRYRLLGKRDFCRIPTEEERERFLE